MAETAVKTKIETIVDFGIEKLKKAQRTIKGIWSKYCLAEYWGKYNGCEITIEDMPEYYE